MGNRESETSLYERIGGREAVEQAVDVFYEKVLADDLVSSFFEGTDMGRQRGKQKAFLSYAFGGPAQYTGKDMRESHSHLDLGEEHFIAIASHLQGTLEELGVAEDLVGQAMAIAASTHDDVLNL